MIDMTDCFIMEQQPCEGFEVEDSVEEFDPNVEYIPGPPGPQGDPGPQGIPGEYSSSNPPPYPVRSVDGRTGDVKVIPEGGTTGQVLKKKSAANYDVEWEAGGGGGSVTAEDVGSSTPPEPFILSVGEGGTGANSAASAIQNLGIFDAIYPVGSIYLSVSNANPGSIFGGTWTQIKDVFLLAAGDTYTAGATGGEATHTLTVDEMPSHTHGFKRVTGAVASGATYARIASGGDAVNDLITNTGGDQAHNNMPPYLAVYVWKRTA